MGVLPIILMVVLAVGGVVTAGVAVLIDIRRRDALRRAGGETGTVDDGFRSVLLGARTNAQDTPIQRAITVMGGWWKTDEKTEVKN